MSTIKSSAENLTLNADGANNDIKFQSNGSEVASIDQAGLLTASGVTVTGVVNVGTGDISSVDSNSIVVGSGATNLRMIGVTNDIRPANADGTNSDNDIDLGDASARFKDLYLSGGLKVGGTGAANTLDDYEEGTWTPVLVGSSTAGSHTYSSQRGFYEKIGRQVTARGQIVINQKNTIAGTVTMSGLPFTQSSETGSYSAMYAGYGSAMSLTAGTSFAGYTNLGQTAITLTLWDNTAGINNLTAANINNSFNIVFALTYMV